MSEFRDDDGLVLPTDERTLFSGSLDVVPLERLMQSFGSAVIHVQCRGEQGRVTMMGGRPVDAEFGQARGAEAVFRMTGPGGSFRVQSLGALAPTEPSIDVTLDVLLEQRRQRRRQRSALLDRLPPAGQPLCAGSGDVDGLNLVELEVLARCDGKRTRDEILLWWRDELAATVAMVRLWEVGAVELVQGEPAVAVAPATQSSQTFLPTLQAAERESRSRQLPIAVALIVLGATAGFIAWLVQVQPEPPRVAMAPVQASAATAEPGLERARTLACPADMVLVEGRTFTLGTDADDAVLERSRPTHRVDVETFCIDRVEVTVSTYSQCVDSGSCKPASSASHWPQGAAEDDVQWQRAKRVYGQLCNADGAGRDEHPVNCVTWSQSASYCEWAGKRLPTGAQWEAAARGPDARRYPWGDELPSVTTGNFCGHECLRWRQQRGLDGGETMHPDRDRFAGTAPVGSFVEGASPYGALDMAGNVFEWTSEQVKTDDGRPAYVIRGGAFNSFRPEFAAAALRFPQDPSARAHGIGFRCVSAPLSR